MTEKPIQVFYSELTGRFYASNRYKDTGGGHVEITGKKYDVTNQIASAIQMYGITFKVKE